MRRCTTSWFMFVTSCIFLLSVTRTSSGCRMVVHRESVSHHTDPSCAPKTVKIFSCLGTCSSFAIPMTDHRAKGGFKLFEHSCTCCKPLDVKTKYIRFKKCNKKIKRSVIRSCKCSPCKNAGNS